MSDPLEGRSLSMDDVRRYLFEQRDRLPMFVVTDHPSDWPHDYVARLHFSLPASEPTGFVIKHPELEPLHAALSGLGLVRTDPAPGDEPVIIEVWL
jgi:hypothetical protein